MLGKNKPSNSRNRVRKDVIASRIVTFFGWLVLGAFVLLIMHLVSNTIPLFKTPHATFEYANSLPNDEPALFSHLVGGSLVHSYRQDCAIQTAIYKRKVKKILGSKRFACNSTFARVKHIESGDVLFAVFHENEIELYRQTFTGERVNTLLQSSFRLEQTFDQLFNFRMAVNAVVHKQKLYLWQINQQGQLTLVSKKLNDFSKANIQQLRDVKTFSFIPFFEQALIELENTTILVDEYLRVQQAFEASPDISYFSLPQSRLIIQNSPRGYLFLGLNNQDGRFLFSPLNTYIDEYYGDILSGNLLSDSGTLLLLTSEQYLLFVNYNTFEVINAQYIGESATHMLSDNSFLYLLGNDRYFAYGLHNTAGIVSLKSLFSQLDYIGYQAPAYVWQTSTSSAQAQKKFSLVPLIVGSIKAAFLSLIIAIPLSLGAAIYTAYFASNRIRSYLKPAIEMVEAIPAVIIGFIAAVWLAPFAEKALINIVFVVITLPVAVLVLVSIHAFVQQHIPNMTNRLIYVFMFFVVFALCVTSLFYLGQFLQSLVMSNNDSALAQIMLSTPITKTSIVVALALGIAITPTIYTLVDDAIFEVPDGIKHAALALGATELQTLTKVVFIVALPTIISAIMLGFGRAFGETMIVLMVTGNTPIADWDLLSGMRSLTSNLAIELQESSQESKHFNILFLTATILFVFTFLINTLASRFKRSMQHEGARD